MLAWAGTAGGPPAGAVLGVAAGICVTGPVGVPFLPVAFLADTTARLIAAVAAALLAGAVVVPRRILIVGEAG